MKKYMMLSVFFSVIAQCSQDKKSLEILREPHPDKTSQVRRLKVPKIDFSKFYVHLAPLRDNWMTDDNKKNNDNNVIIKKEQSK